MLKKPWFSPPRPEYNTVDQRGRVLSGRDIAMSRAFGREVYELTQEQKNAYQAAAHGAAYGMSAQQFAYWCAQQKAGRARP